MAITQAQRRRAAQRGTALPNGTFPVRNGRELRAAIRLNGRSATYSRARVRAHIRRRARALHMTGAVPETWR